jgi:hypothetical protein
MAIIDIGQRIKQTFSLVDSGTAPTFTECENNIFDCGFMMPVFAGGTGDLENDKSSILAMFQAWTTAAVFTIQKEEGGPYKDKATFSNSYGTLYPLGFSTSKPKYTGILIEWEKVLAAFGEGVYRIEIKETNTLGDKLHYSKPYCLKTWNCELTNNTVRLEWENNRGIGDIENDRNILDFANINWYAQLRLPQSIFGYPLSTYEVSEIQYNNGQQEDYKNVQEEKYTLTTGQLPAWVHDIIKTYACQSQTLRVTDYSNNNPQMLIEKSVKLTSAYEPRWSRQSKCASVTLEFKPRFNRLETFYCI